MLELFSTRCDGLTLTDVSKGLGLPKSSTLGLLRTLHGRGYLVREADDLYKLNDIVRRDGFARHGRLLRVAPPAMRALADELGETVILAITGSPGMVRLIAKEVATREVRFDVDLPRQEPAYCTAIGRVLLGAQDDAQVATALAAVPRRQVTDATLTDQQAIEERIAEARRSGVSIVEDELVLGATGIAALIPRTGQQTLAALNVGCISARFNANRERIILALQTAANGIGSAMQPDRAA
ncbi:IclR family transcriptional regulator [Sphingomonas sp. BK235]|nr:IclR family transcriptional regulator [Sphingomonas sp. BK235]